MQLSEKPGDISLHQLNTDLLQENHNILLPPLKTKTMSFRDTTLFKTTKNQLNAQENAPQFRKPLLFERRIDKFIKNDRQSLHYISVLKKNQNKAQELRFQSTKTVKLAKINHVNVGLKRIQDQYKNREMCLEKHLSTIDILDNYKILSHIGKGSFSIVSLAVDKHTNVRYAIKTYNKIDQIQNYQFDNIYKEINHLQQLEHKNIVGLYHVIKDKKKILLIMENAGKLSLAGLLRKCKTIPQSVAKPIFRQILEAISYSHSKGICHRDLKLENILIDSSNIVKLIDFGFSSKCNQKLQTYCGTPPYMSPQITSKTPYNGEPADIWSLGILLYLMLYGKFPFRASSQKQLYRLIQQGKYQTPDDASFQAKQIISHMLKCNAKDRYTAEQVLGSAWLRL